MMHLRALWAVGATLLAFASEGLQGLMASSIGAAGTQAGVIGAAVLAYLCLEVFAPGPPAKRKRPVRKPASTQKKRAPRPKRP